METPQGFLENNGFVKNPTHDFNHLKRSQRVCAPEHGWFQGILEYSFSFGGGGIGLFSGANLLLVSGRVMGFKAELEEYDSILAWLGLKV